MAETSMPSQPNVEKESTTANKGESSTLVRLTKFTAARLVALFATVVVGVYISILVANMGGAVDDIRRGAIREQVSISVSMDPELRVLPTADRMKMIDDLVAVEERRLGLDRPFILRSFAFLASALTLDLGRSENMTSDKGSRLVRNIILERLPPTLLLSASSFLLIFFASVFLALILSRQYGSWLDKAIIALAPTSAAPGWFYGLFLILIFAAILGVLPFGGMVDSPPPDNPIEYGLSVLKHLTLPLLATVVSAIFISIYNWRTFFLIFSSEDYVEMARAKGLSSRQIERRYVLRPTLPFIITSFALSLITLWAGSIILETIFNWPGLGRLIFQAIGLYDTPVIIASVVIYAYLLAITVFLLDFIYALVDPRVRVGEGGKKA